MTPAWPPEDEVIGWIAGLRGPDPSGGTAGDRGALSHITGETVAAAAASVRDGTAVSCALDIVDRPQAGDIHGPPQRYMARLGRSRPSPAGRDPSSIPPGGRADACAEYIAMFFHGPNVTHLDALCHTTWDGRTFGGLDVAGIVTAETGAARLSVAAASQGVVTRGVLLDAARAAGVPALEPGTPVDVEVLERIEADQGVRVGPGDAVLLRTGHGHLRAAGGASAMAGPWSGWHPGCLPWFRERRVALVGSDGFNEALPNPYQDLRLPVHVVGQVALGLWLLDNCDLEALASAARDRRRWSFQFVVAPLRIEGGTGSPVNPIAVF